VSRGLEPASRRSPPTSRLLRRRRRRRRRRRPLHAAAEAAGMAAAAEEAGRLAAARLAAAAQAWRSCWPQVSVNRSCFPAGCCGCRTVHTFVIIAGYDSLVVQWLPTADCHRSMTYRASLRHAVGGCFSHGAQPLQRVLSWPMPQASLLRLPQMATAPFQEASPTRCEPTCLPPLLWALGCNHPGHCRHVKMKVLCLQ
jgi:hypothetical protein